MNHELYELNDDVELARSVKIQRIRLLGHVIRMGDRAPTREVYENAP